MKSRKIPYLDIFWLLILCVYWAAILSINFSKEPTFYDTDMYTDMLYAQKAWEHKSVFPEGWIFGNQTYVVATPVLASLFWGLTGDLCLSMGLASTIMGVGVLLSFSWMLKPIFKKRHERLACITIFMTLMLTFGDGVTKGIGWQLLYTMCSYYACYAITVFLAFGLYLRSRGGWTRKTGIILGFACVMSFGTGMQSLRQTTIMVLPLLAAELLRLVICIVKKRKFLNRSTTVVALLALCNLGGLITKSILPIDQAEAFGTLRLRPFGEIFSSILPCVKTACSLFGSVGLLCGAVLLVICVFVLLQKQWPDSSSIRTYIFLFIAGFGVLFAIAVFTTMYVRNAYYFLAYPFAAFLLTCLYARFGKILRYLVVVPLLLLVVLNSVFKICWYFPVFGSEEYFQPISDHLESEGITTVYSCWNSAEKVAIASNGKIRAGFWTSVGAPFEPVGYLCDPEVYNAEPSKCAYYFGGKGSLEIGMQAAAERNVELTILKHFEDIDVYICVADAPLMQWE